MGQKRHTAEQIIGKLREAEVELAKGKSPADAALKLWEAATAAAAEAESSPGLEEEPAAPDEEL